MDSEDFLLDSYDYDLPEEMIAQVPAQPAESAKLLVFSRSDSSIQDNHFYDLPNLLSNNDILVCNNTKVFKARIPLYQTKIIRKSWQERYIDGEIFVYQLLHDGRLECLVSDDKNFKPWAEVFLDEEKWISLTSDEYAEDIWSDATSTIYSLWKGERKTISNDFCTGSRFSSSSYGISAFFWKFTFRFTFKMSGDKLYDFACWTRDFQASLWIWY